MTPRVHQGRMGETGHLMKLIKILVVLAAILAAGVVGAGLLIEPRWTVERSAAVKATPEAVLAYVGELRHWNEWTVWTKEKYPDMTVEHPGPTSGVGAVQKWHDGSMEGEIEITEFRPDSHLEYALDMDRGRWQMNCRIAAVAVTDTEPGSVVTWSCAGDSGGNPVNRIMQKIFEPLIGEDFQNGLDRLARRFSQSS